MSREDVNREGRHQNAAGPAQPRQRGWWSRNWLWFVPTLLLALVVLGGSGIYWSLFTRVFHLDVCQSAMQQIAADPGLRQELGQPIKPVRWGLPPSARVEEGEKDVRWDIEGPQGRAKAHVHARLMQGQWETDQLEVTLANGRRIPIAAGGDSAAEAPVFAPKTDAKKPETKDAAPEINLAVPPTNEPGK